MIEGCTCAKDELDEGCPHHGRWWPYFCSHCSAVSEGADDGRCSNDAPHDWKRQRPGSVQRCPRNSFGHNPADAGNGCDGCDKEHARMMDKHVGPILPGTSAATPVEMPPHVIAALPTDATGLLVCSFCGKTQREIKQLIAGPHVLICNECVGLCNGLLPETASPEDDRAVWKTKYTAAQVAATETIGTMQARINTLEVERDEAHAALRAVLAEAAELRGRVAGLQEALDAARLTKRPDEGRRIEELETALRSTLTMCEDCGTFATWNGYAPSTHGYHPSYCDSCKVRHEKDLGTGRLVGQLVFSRWERLTRNIELTGIYATSAAPCASQAEADQDLVSRVVRENMPKASTKTKLEPRPSEAWTPPPGVVGLIAYEGGAPDDLDEIKFSTRDLLAFRKRRERDQADE